MPLNPKSMEKKTQYVKSREGREPRVYLDPKEGRIPTIGYGYALADANRRLSAFVVLHVMLYYHPAIWHPWAQDRCLDAGGRWHDGKCAIAD